MATVTNQVPHTVTSECAVERVLAVLKDHWSMLILRDLLEKDKPMRFNELKRSLNPISAKILAERLAEVVGAGIIKRTVHPETPVRVEYSLTEKGRALNDVFEEIRAWGEKWMPVEARTNLTTQRLKETASN
jgi:DNA-binding HxlR family transcriptional regulator